MPSRFELVQPLWRAKKAGEPVWRTFWKGGPALSDNQTPEPDLARPASTVLRDFVTGGVSFPWTLMASAGLGILLLATPLVMGRSRLYTSAITSRAASSSWLR